MDKTGDSGLPTAPSEESSRCLPLKLETQEGKMNMRTYSENNLQTGLANLSTNPVPGGIAEIAEHDLVFVSGGKTTVKGDKITVKPNGEVICSGGCTATVG